jgi:hypothetical protein
MNYLLYIKPATVPGIQYNVNNNIFIIRHFQFLSEYLDSLWVTPNKITLWRKLVL